MTPRKPSIRVGLVVAAVLAAANAVMPRPVAAQDEDGAVHTGQIEDDLFAAGGSVHVTATIGGDLFVAGGWVDVQSEVGDNLIAAGGMMDLAGATVGDLIAAGGIVDVAARIRDNLVAAGAVVSLEGRVDGKLFIAAARLRLGRNARAAGGAWLAAGSADIGGEIAGATTIAAGRAILRGRIAGDVEVTALSLEIADSAVIEGRLVHYGPDPPEIGEGARIEGGVDHRYQPKGEGAAGDDDWPPVFWLLITLGLGLLLHLLVPRYLESAGGRAIARPIASFGLGLAILFVTPVMIVIMLVSVLGFAVGIAAIAAYGTLLLLGPVVALFGITRLLGRVRAGLVGTAARRRIAFGLALLALAALSALPYVGSPLFWSVMVLGLGAATWQLYDSIRAEPAPPSSKAAPVEP